MIYLYEVIVDQYPEDLEYVSANGTIELIAASASSFIISNPFTYETRTTSPLYVTFSSPAVVLGPVPGTIYVRSVTLYTFNGAVKVYGLLRNIDISQPNFINGSLVKANTQYYVKYISIRPIKVNK
jgi:hypothetical protein